MRKIKERLRNYWHTFCQSVIKGQLYLFILNFFKICLLFIAFIVLVLIIWIAIREYRDESIIVEPFSVSAELKEQGYAGDFFANKLIDQLSKIQCQSSIAEGSREREYIPKSKKVDVSLEVGGVKTSLRTIIDLLKSDRKNITGEVSTENNDHIITVRIE